MLAIKRSIFLVLTASCCFALALTGTASPVALIDRSSSPADGGGLIWPVIVEYKVTEYYEEMTVTNVHRFEGVSWDEWRDVVLESRSSPDSLSEKASQEGAIQQLDRSRGQLLIEPPAPPKGEEGLASVNQIIHVDGDSGYITPVVLFGPDLTATSDDRHTVNSSLGEDDIAGVTSYGHIDQSDVRYDATVKVWHCGSGEPLCEHGERMDTVVDVASIPILNLPLYAESRVNDEIVESMNVLSIEHVPELELPHPW